MDSAVRPADQRTSQPVSTPILVAEDDPQLRAMFLLLLQGEGHPVVTAEDGIDAMRYAQTMRPSLVILDLDLPYLDGHAVAAQLRVLHGDALPIVIVTATGQAAARASDIKPCAYLHKPFDVDGFLTLVGRCLERTP